ncbi:MAG: hypothetical protein QOD24_3721 [Solirubrobacteraceae bacterium]|jgi:hypothetical protein|nr:hypothetical protein [Solirubrobacteraceae bacterium]
MRPLAAATAACLALAAASLALGHEPVYDAWAWLVWGRELASLGLDISSGPSWKPLPVALAVPLSVAGDAAPELWLVFVRAAWLLALVLAAQLAAQLAAGTGARRGARIAAGAFAAASLALLTDPVTAWGRQAAGGMSEPLLVALVLGALRAQLGGRPRLALLCGALAALVRPEVWPLLAAYGLWRWRAEPATRPLLAALALALPALWLGPDLLAAGDAFGSAARAQRDGGGPLVALARAAALPLAAAWPLALVAVAGRDRRLLVLGAGALGWIAIVAAMAAAGFPGLPRFMAPPAAVVGVLGGAGLARLIAARRAPAVAALGVVLAGVTALQLPGRVAELPRALRTTARVGHSHDRLRALAGAVGHDALLRCGNLATSDVLVRTALAWELRVPLADVVSFGAPPRLSGAFVVGPQASPRLRDDVRAVAEPLGAQGEWRAYSLQCPPPSAGVSGAHR